MNKVYLAVVLACWGSAALAAEQVEVNQAAGLQGAPSGAAGVSALAGDGEFRQVRAVKLPNGQQRVRSLARECHERAVHAAHCCGRVDFRLGAGHAVSCHTRTNGILAPFARFQLHINRHLIVV